MNQPYQPSDALVLNVISDTHDIPFYAVAKSGVTNAGGFNQLKDSSVNFIDLGIKNGMTVWNTTSNTVAKIVSIIDAATLQIDADIFPSLGDDYKIFSSPNPGALLWVAQENLDVQITTLGGDTVVLKNVPRNEIIPIRVSRVWQTGTTVTPPNIIALW